MRASEEAPPGIEVPLIIRVAGLPADIVEAFSSTALIVAIERLSALEQAIAQARAELVERLYSAIQGAPHDERRVLIEMKRDCFNGRELAKYRHRQEPPQARGLIESLVAKTLLLEEQLAQVMAEFEATYQAERTREIRALLPCLENRRFLRGVALGSRELMSNVPRLHRKHPAEYGRRERQLVSSLLRYATRSALKLSPFSTLTRIGLGCINGDLHKPFLLRSPSECQEESKVRMQRFIVDQLESLLLRYGSFRDHVPVVVNGTVENRNLDCFRFISPGRWALDGNRERLEQSRPALVNARLRGPLITWLLTNARQPDHTYRQLVDILSAEVEEVDHTHIEQTVERLLDLGFLVFSPPWTNSDLHAERRLYNFMVSIPRNDARLENLAALLKRMIELQEIFATAEDVAYLANEGRCIVREMIRCAASLGGIPPQVADVESKEWFLYEDVFLKSASPPHDVARLSHHQAEEIVYSLSLLTRLSNLFSSRHDFLHSLAAFAESRWPGQSLVSFTDVFAESYGLFQEYIRSSRERRVQSSRDASVINPMQLPVLDELGNLRKRVVTELDQFQIREEGQVRLDDRALTQLLDEIPSPYAEPRSFCAFLQPAHGSTWALNLLAEGDGRLSSRYTTLMGTEMRESFTSHFIKASLHRKDGQLEEIVDLFCPAGHTASVHEPHTMRVFETPGVPSGLPPERHLQLRNLHVRFSGAGHLPELIDTDGRRILPVHLGPLAYPYLPSIIKFLSLFGPGELRFVTPGAKRQSAGNGVDFIERHAIGNIIYFRRTWIFRTEPLRSALAGLSPAKTFAAFDRWRRVLGIPDRVFLAEPQGSGVSLYTKPQYIDFSSAILVDLFRSVIEKDAPFLRLAEALPQPDKLPLLEDGKRWAFEFQLDSSGFFRRLGDEPFLTSFNARIRA